MFIVSKRNIILPSADGKRAFRVSRDYIGEIPDWAADTEYFRALAADGKIGVPDNHSDQALEAAGKRGRRGRKGQQETEPGSSLNETETGEPGSSSDETETGEPAGGAE